MMEVKHIYFLFSKNCVKVESPLCSVCAHWASIKTEGLRLSVFDAVQPSKLAPLSPSLFFLFPSISSLSVNNFINLNCCQVSAHTVTEA